ncbi:hypothetical protein K9L67_02165 [Candidatus Woesearchaeota archaeon]|nr:hypothetical protein [Candidatus Woesearchaeota archaeon]MCF7901009.1 hypothetical protein [Candidatus Woesearchaeota archaeon]MCF8013275.1 hypothetical protein [Candidatus Woesearchaeota archaeon]
MVEENYSGTKIDIFRSLYELNSLNILETGLEDLEKNTQEISKKLQNTKKK